MEKRKAFMLKNLMLADFRFELADEEAGASKPRVNVYPTFANWMMLNRLADGSIVETGYTEQVLDAPTSVKPKPISSEGDPERAVFIMGLPAPGTGMNFKMVVSSDALSDSVGMERVTGSYASFRAAFPNDTVMMESPGKFFTVKVGEASYETYIYINMAEQVVRLTHTDVNTFDTFRFSFMFPGI